MEKIIFENYKSKIITALKQKGDLKISEPVTLIDGFVNQPLQGEISGSITIGGPSIPMIMLIGNNSGRIYFFALKAILPDIKI